MSNLNPGTPAGPTDTNAPPTAPVPPAPGAVEEGDATHGIIPYKNPAALAGYYTSIAGLLIPLVGIVALVLGIKGLRARNKNPRIRGTAHAWVAIILGALATLGWVGCGATVLLGAFVGGGGSTRATPAPAAPTTP